MVKILRFGVISSNSEEKREGRVILATKQIPDIAPAVKPPQKHPRGSAGWMVVGELT
jgi:hypothetical protein